MPDATLQWIIATGAVLLALGTSLWAVHEGVRRRALSIAFRRARQSLETVADRADTLLQTDPDYTFVWEEGAGPTIAATGLKDKEGQDLRAPDLVLGNGFGSHARGDTSTKQFEEFFARLTEEARADFTRKVAQLRQDGVTFTAILARDDGGVLDVSGRTAGARAIVKLHDVSPERQEIDRLCALVKDMEAECAGLYDILKHAPFPIWRRRGPNLVWVNESYARAVEADDVNAAVSNKLEIDRSEPAFAALACRTGDVQKKTRYVVSGGQRRAMELIEIPTADGTGGMALDVSAVDEIQQNLERHLEAQKDTLDKLRTGVAIFGTDTRLTFYNNAYARLWDLDQTWLSGEPEEGEILDKLREKQRVPEQANFQEWKRQRRALYTEMVDGDEVWHLPDGRAIRVVVRAHPFGGLIYLFDDVTDLITLEQSYNTLISVQRATLDHLHEGVALFGSDGRLKLSNAAFAKMWGFDPGLLSSEPHLDVITEHCRPQLGNGRDWQRVAEWVTGFVPGQTFKPRRLHRQDDGIINVAADALPDGRILLSFLDVTDTATIERALREKNEALETADRLKSEFIANVSYQLRTPLNSILGFGEMLDTGLVGKLSERQKEYTGNILEASKQLRDLINDILDLAMIEAGTMTLDLTDVSLEDLMENARQVAVSRAHDSELTVKVDCQDSIGTIKADERRLRQVLFNLTSNAMTYTQAGGLVTLGVERDADGVRLWVSDTGTGIPEEYLSTVFDRFSGGPSNRRGAGLGLALVKSFIELHGGWVTLESEPDKGTKVVCHIPATRQVTDKAA